MRYLHMTNDQANTLRLLAGSRNNTACGTVSSLDAAAGKGSRVISVTSGKGGVGKSNVVVNLAVSLAKTGKRVLVIDADLGLGNIDVLLGLKSQFTLNDMFSGNLRLADIIIDGPGGIRIVPSGSGVQRYTSLSRDDRIRLMDELETLEETFDYVLIDSESGISRNVTYFNTAASEILLVVAPEPTSITDVYAIIKLLTQCHGEESFKVLVNMARDINEGLQVYKKLSQVVSRFLEVSLDYVGCVVRDDRLLEAVRRQKPVVDLYPRTPASHCFTSIASHIHEGHVCNRVKGNIQFFFRKHFESSPVQRCI